MIEYITKDVTTVQCGVIAHGVNCQGVMGAGVAKAIRDMWPVVFNTYKNTCSDDVVPASLLGKCEVITIHKPDPYIYSGLYVLNLFTQVYYGRDQKAYASVEAVDETMEQCLAFCNGVRLPLYMPRIGCGLGGLNWESDVQPIVERYAAHYGVSVYVCDI